MPRFGRVVLGGTFDRLHVGHEALLATAFREGRTVAIGVTTDEFLEDHPKPGAARIASYRARRAALVRWLSARYARARWTVVPLANRFGRSTEAGVDALVISADTLEGGRAVNAERRRLGHATVPLIVVPLVLGDDLVPVSSRRIRAGTIDRRGRRRGPIDVLLVTPESLDRRAAAVGVRRAFPRAHVAPAGRDGKSSPARDRRTATPELTVTISRPSGRTVSIGVTKPGIRLPGAVVAVRSPRELTSAVARALRRSAGPKPFKRRPQ